MCGTRSGVHTVPTLPFPPSRPGKNHRSQAPSYLERSAWTRLINANTPEEILQLLVPTTINAPDGDEVEALNTQNEPSCDADAIQQARGPRRRAVITNLAVVVEDVSAYMAPQYWCGNTYKGAAGGDTQVFRSTTISAPDGKGLGAEHAKRAFRAMPT